MMTRAEQLLISGDTDTVTGALIGMLTIASDDSEDVELALPVYNMTRAMVAARVHMRDEYGVPIRWTELRGNLGFERYVALSEHLWLTEELREALNDHLDAIGIDDDIRARLANWRRLQEQGYPVATWKAERAMLPPSFVRVASRHDDHVNGLRRPDMFRRPAKTSRTSPGWSPPVEIGVLALLAVIAFQWWNWPMLVAWGETVRHIGVIAIGVLGVATAVSAVSLPMRAVRDVFAGVLATAALGAVAWAMRPGGFVVLTGLVLPAACAVAYRFPFVQEETLETEGTWRAAMAMGWLAFTPAAFAPWFVFQDAFSFDDIMAVASLGVGAMLQGFLVYALIRRIDWHRARVAEDVHIEMQDQREADEAAVGAAGEEVLPLADERWPS